MRLLCDNSGNVPRLWILGSFTIGDVTLLISHVQHVIVVISWSGVVHQISFIYGSVNYNIFGDLFRVL